MAKFDFCEGLEDLFRRAGYKVPAGEIFSYLRTVAAAEICNTPSAPGPVGPMGPVGAPGEPGPAGQDAWDKYRWDSKTETMFTSSWKGIEFTFPLPTCFVEGFPEGELSYGDINYIRTIYGNMVVETMAVFWRRAYDYHTDMQLFINQEDSCRLQSINQSNSFPDPLKD